MPIVTVLGNGRTARAAAINDDGVVVGAEDGSAFVWRPVTPNATTGTLLRLRPLDGNLDAKSEAVAINRHGDVVGFSEFPDAAGIVVTRAVRWPAGTLEPISLGTLRPLQNGSVGSSRASGIDDFGRVVGVSDVEVGTRGFVFEPTLGSMFELPRPLLDLAAGPSEALAINNGGHIVGAHFVHSGARLVRAAFHWHWLDPTTVTGTRLLGMGKDDVARAINSFGIIVGDVQPGELGGGTSVAALLSATAEPQIIVESRFCTALGINDAGTVVGSEGQDMPRAYRVTFGEFEDLSNLSPPLRITHATAVNTAGQVAGVANDGTRDLAVLITF